MRYRNVDLNLFALFEALLKHGSVRGAARELGVTASAASHGLARLRRALGDELFVAGPHGMQPTARASELAPRVADGLATLAEALAGRVFDPASTARTFVVASTDYVTALIVPHLVRRLARFAPGAYLKMFPSSRIDVVQQLDEGRVDVVMGWFGTLPDRIHRQAMLMEREALVVRPGHPLLRGRLTKQRLLAHSHVVVELTGSESANSGGFVDERGAARRIWIERLLIEEAAGRGTIGRVAVTVPRYCDVSPIVAATDLVATLPRRLAQLAAERDGLVILPLPYEPLEVAHEMIWHERAADEPGTRWLLGQIEAALKSVAD